MPLACRILGHRFGGVISGFRNTDGAVIGRCRRCNAPIVAADCRASQSLKMDLDAITSRAMAELTGSGVPAMAIGRSEVMRRTTVYDSDRF